MKKFWIVGFCTVLLSSAVGAAEDSWKIYRNEKYGYQISYPPDLKYEAFINGSSGELKDAHTGKGLVSFEVWPPDECPRQPAGTTARDVGIERAKTITQSDGPEGSSYCADPLMVRDYLTHNGAKYASWN